MAALHLEEVSGADEGLRTALAGADLPTDDLNDEGRRFYRFTEARQVVGYGGYEPLGEHALLRSVVVVAAARGHGHGRRIVSRLMTEMQAAGARQAFLLTTTAGPFFEHLGFRSIDRSSAPPAIRETRQAATICSTATLLTRPLRHA
jgi:N-acetylglutamate synthase-like GNAT family acetyltransferase